MDMKPESQFEIDITNAAFKQALYAGSIAWWTVSSQVARALLNGLSCFLDQRHELHPQRRSFQVGNVVFFGVELIRNISDRQAPAGACQFKCPFERCFSDFHGQRNSEPIKLFHL